MEKYVVHVYVAIRTQAASSPRPRKTTTSLHQARLWVEQNVAPGTRWRIDRVETVLESR